VQGGVLSLHLFNYYLDKALRSSQLIAKVISEGRLLTFADDIMIRIHDKRELEEVISALDQQEGSFVLTLKNK
jgi:hypothetical protein